MLQAVLPLLSRDQPNPALSTTELDPQPQQLPKLRSTHPGSTQWDPPSELGLPWTDTSPCVSLILPHTSIHTQSPMLQVMASTPILSPTHRKPNPHTREERYPFKMGRFINPNCMYSEEAEAQTCGHTGWGGKGISWLLSEARVRAQGLWGPRRVELATKAVMQVSRLRPPNTSIICMGTAHRPLTGASHCRPLFFRILLPWERIPALSSTGTQPHRWHRHGCCPRFIENITAQQKDSNGSTWCFEIHPNCRLSDLQVGQTAKVLEQ